jgi:hypothetical protein
VTQPATTPLALARFEPTSASGRHLERAHALVHVAVEAIAREVEPNAHLEPAARRIEQGLGAMYDAFDGRADRPTAIARARARLWDAAILVARGGLVAALAALRDACSELTSAEERFPRVPLAMREAAPIRSSGDEPGLHRVERASLVPTLRAPPAPELAEEPAPIDLPEPTTFEELRAVAAAAQQIAKQRIAAAIERGKPAPRLAAPPAPEPPPGFAFAPGAALPEDDFVRRWARECVDEIAMLGIQRAPQVGDDWRTCSTLERRMMRALDALAALGPTAIAYVEPYVLDAPAADPLKVFAMAFVGGCLEGRDILAGAERVLLRFGPGDPAIAAAFVSAMKLSTNPFAPGALRGLLASEDPARRAIAVEVMVKRGWLAPDELGALAVEEDPRVLALALPALARAGGPDLEGALRRALGHADEALHLAALDAMALVGHPRAGEGTRAASRGSLGERAYVALALVGDDGDRRWLVDRLRASPTRATVEAVGWAGVIDAVPLLIGVLTIASDDQVKRAAGEALDRILGARLLDTIQVFPEREEEIEVRDPEPEPLAPRVGDPRDLPSPGSPEDLEVPSMDPARWRAYWLEHGKRFDVKVRHRRGRPHAADVLLDELDAATTSAADRRRLVREPVLAALGVAFDPDDLVVDQERAIAALRAAARR